MNCRSWSYAISVQSTVKIETEVMKSIYTVRQLILKTGGMKVIETKYIEGYCFIYSK